MGSTRLPGKVMADLEGAPMIVRVLERLERAQRLDDVILATSDAAADDALADAVARTGRQVHRGSHHDVLARYVSAAHASNADVVVRVTGDCPLIDGEILDRVVAALEIGVDYSSNVIERTFPRGLDVEALPVEVLEQVDRLASSPESREHVTWFLYQERPDLFALWSVVDDVDNSDLSWVVDTPEDLDRMREIYRTLDVARHPRSYRELLAYVRSN
jgi:spore coat polysaccharide biosynthesis protein SpsF (cytidylyltransferase family)